MQGSFGLKRVWKGAANTMSIPSGSYWLDRSRQGQVPSGLLLRPQEVEEAREPSLQALFYFGKALILFMRASRSRSSQPQIPTSKALPQRMSVLQHLRWGPTAQSQLCLHVWFAERLESRFW